MAQKRSQQSDQPPPTGEAAARALVHLRSGRTAREILGRPANDNRLGAWASVVRAALIVAAIAALGYAVLRLIN